MRAPKPSALKSIINHLLDGEVPHTEKSGMMFWYGTDNDGWPMYQIERITDDEISALTWCQS